MRQSIDNFVELAKEEVELALASEWKVENERAKLKVEYQKVKQSLKSYQEKLTT